MVELIPYFAALIMCLFGVAFISAMWTFRRLSKEKSEKPPISPAANESGILDSGDRNQSQAN